MSIANGKPLCVPSDNTSQVLKYNRMEHDIDFGVSYRFQHVLT